MADQLADDIRNELASAMVNQQQRLALREHALYCSTVLYNGWLIASGGVRPDSREVLATAEVFLEWLNVRPDFLAELRERSDG